MDKKYTDRSYFLYIKIFIFPIDFQGAESNTVTLCLGLKFRRGKYLDTFIYFE